MKKTLITLIFTLGIICVLFSSCGNKEKAHKFEYFSVEATCTSEGYTEARCQKCGKIEISDFTPLKEHVPGETEYTAASCQSDGKSVKRCINCQGVIEEEITAAKLDHKAGEWVTVEKSTCTSAGKKEKRCTLCNEIIEIQSADFAEHMYEISYRTDNSIRYRVFTCKVCGNTYKNQLNLPEDITPNDIYNMVSDATVQIQALDKNGNAYSIGSGFLISSDGKMVTNYHVISSAYKLRVIRKSGDVTYVDQILGYDKVNDIAILDIIGSSLPHLKISYEKLKTGDSVYTLGSPLGLSDTFSSGIVSNPSKTVNGNEYIQFTSPISPGNSGGPLVNYKGEVVGINTMTTVDGQNINFAVKSRLIDKVDISKPIYPSELYSKFISENALEIIKNYICIYASSSDLDTYVFAGKEVAESDYGYGTEPFLIYDSERDLFTMRVYLVSDNKYRFAIEMTVFDLESEYYVSLFDYDKNQTMITSTVKTGVELGDYDTCFDKAFTVIRNRYNPNTIITGAAGETYTEQEAAQVIIYQSYQTLVGEFDKILKASGTGLTLEHFGLVKPER